MIECGYGRFRFSPLQPHQIRSRLNEIVQMEK